MTKKIFWPKKIWQLYLNFIYTLRLIFFKLNNDFYSEDSSRLKLLVLFLLLKRTTYPRCMWWSFMVYFLRDSLLLSCWLNTSKNAYEDCVWCRYFENKCALWGKQALKISLQLIWRGIEKFGNNRRNMFHRQHFTCFCPRYSTLV